MISLLSHNSPNQITESLPSPEGKTTANGIATLGGTTGY